MDKNGIVMVSLCNEVLTYDIENYQIDIDFCNGIAGTFSYGCTNGKEYDDKSDKIFLDSFLSRFGVSVSSTYYEILKGDPNVVKLLVDSDGSFGAYSFCETLGSNIQKLELVYSGIVKVAV